MPHFLRWWFLMQFLANNFIWNVFEVNPNNHNLCRNDGNGYALGMCDNRTKCIFISNQLSEEKRELVIAHEIYHAFLFSYGITIYDSQLEEDLCNLFSEHGREMITILDNLLYQILEEY